MGWRFAACCLLIVMKFIRVIVGVVCVILRLAVLVELRLVTDTDRQKDRHRPMASTADA